MPFTIILLAFVCSIRMMVKRKNIIPRTMSLVARRDEIEFTKKVVI